MMWSSVGLNGWGYFSEKSTGFPHIAHTDWVAYILFRFFSSWPLCRSLNLSRSVAMFPPNTKPRICIPGLCMLICCLMRVGQPWSRTKVIPVWPRCRRRSPAWVIRSRDLPSFDAIILTCYLLQYNAIFYKSQRLLMQMEYVPHGEVHRFGYVLPLMQLNVSLI